MSDTESPERALLRRILRDTGCEMFLRGTGGTGGTLTFYDEDMSVADEEAALIQELWS